MRYGSALSHQLHAKFSFLVAQTHVSYPLLLVRAHAYMGGGGLGLQLAAAERRCWPAPYGMQCLPELPTHLATAASAQEAFGTSAANAAASCGI